MRKNSLCRKSFFFFFFFMLAKQRGKRKEKLPPARWLLLFAVEESGAEGWAALGGCVFVGVAVKVY